MNARKLLNLMMGAVLIVLSACGDDDKDQPTDTEAGSRKLTSMTVYGQTLASLRYDDLGRVTRIKVEDLIINISYSPLRIEFVDDGEVTVWRDIVTNKDGYILSAKLTEEYEGGVDTWNVSMTYDSDNHILSSRDGEGAVMTLRWDGNYLTKLNYEYEEGSFYQILTYSDVVNKAKNVSLMWCELSIYWLTGLFGEVPGYLPSSVYSSDDGEIFNLAYKLNPDGSIAKEQVIFEDAIPMVIDYNYNVSRTQVSDPTACIHDKSIIKTNIFHRRRS